VKGVRVLIAALVAAAALTACELTYQPEVGPLLPGASSGPDGGGGTDDAGGLPATGPCDDSDPATPVSFGADVRPLMFKPMGGCGCHASSATSGFNLGTYDRLRRGGLISGTAVVVAGQPCSSILVQKLGLAPPFGSRMPYNGPPYYTQEELQMVRDWIAEGALNN
jgi:hypothetical protein